MNIIRRAMRKNDSLIIAVDFDGTICTNNYPNCGSPNTVLIKKLIRLREAGHKLILWTCRTDNELKVAVDYCKKYGLEFDKINENLDELVQMFEGDTRKVVADIYLDDKAMNPISFITQFMA